PYEAAEHEAAAVSDLVRIRAPAPGARGVDGHREQGERDDQEERQQVRSHRAVSRSGSAGGPSSAGGPGERSRRAGRSRSTFTARGQRKISGSRRSSEVRRTSRPVCRSTFRTTYGSQLAKVTTCFIQRAVARTLE